MTTALVIGLLATPSSGAAGAFTPSADSRAQGLVARVSAPVSSGELDGASPDSCKNARKAIRFYRQRYASWRAKMGQDSQRSKAAQAVREGACPYYLAAVLKRKAYAARLAFESWYERTYEKWRCIHEKEGAWNDPNPPHYGGLQFDDSFQRTYGPEFYRRWGDAGNWPVYAQLEAAERAYHGFRQWGARGFGPWPNTRRMCGV